MTGLEALNDFNIQSRMYQDTSKIKFKTTEIQYLLNRGQDAIFHKYYEAFEKTEDKRFALDELITPASLDWATYESDSQVGAKTNGRIWKMPADVYYIVEESALDSNGNFIRIKPIKRDYYSVNLDNPLKQPDKTLAWRLDHKPTAGDGTNIKRRETVSADEVTIVTYNITYIKKPDSIDVTDTSTELELGYKAMREVIAEAVKLAYAADKDQVGYQISQAEKIEKQDKK